MKKYDNRIKLNFFEKIAERFRLRKEIKKREKDIEMKLLKIAKSKKRLLDYKWSGIPVDKENLVYLKRSLDTMVANPKYAVRNTRSDKGKKRIKIATVKDTREIENNFRKLNAR